MPLFRHRNGRVVRYPAHFINSPISKNLELVDEDVETEKVVLEFSPNSQTRAGRKTKEAEPEPELLEEEDK